MYYAKDVSIGFIGSINLKYQILEKSALGLRFTYERDDFLILIESEVFF